MVSVADLGVVDGLTSVVVTVIDCELLPEEAEREIHAGGAVIFQLIFAEVILKAPELPLVYARFTVVGLTDRSVAPA